MLKESQPALEKIILGLVLLLANLRALVIFSILPDTSIFFGQAWIEVLLWVLAIVGVIHLLWQDGQMIDFLVLWRENWLLAVFILLVAISIVWSVGRVFTLFRFLEIFSATFIAAYFGMRLRPRQMMNTLFWFGAVLLIFSIGLVYGAPNLGAMNWELMNGAWRGVYWHRNHLGSVAALLNILYLLRLVTALKERNATGVLDAFFYVLSLVIVIFTRSATGYILIIVLHGSVLLVLLWLNFSHRLRRIHYLSILATGILAAVPVLTNLGFVFGLFGRSASMTGRTGLWSHLLEVAAQRPWLGHGFGAYWTIVANRKVLRLQTGWIYQPVIGDNGLLDIYLHLGIVGVVLFVAVLAWATIRAVRYGVAEKTLVGFFPLLVMIYAVFANISFSLFAETEVFVWFLIVAALFMTTSLSKR